MSEEIITTAKAYLTDHSKVVVIPKKLRRKLGEDNTSLFIVKLDDKDRIIYEPIKRAGEKPTETCMHAKARAFSEGKNSEFH